jgi:hypothetical protein
MAIALRYGKEMPKDPDRIIVHRAERDLSQALGVFDGLYEPGYLEKLRSEERGAIGGQLRRVPVRPAEDEQRLLTAVKAIAPPSTSGFAGRSGPRAFASALRSTRDERPPSYSSANTTRTVAVTVDAPGFVGGVDSAGSSNRAWG